MFNTSCAFSCGLMYELRQECTEVCTSVQSTCSAQYPQLQPNSDAYFDACQSYCCSKIYPLSVAFFAALAVVGVLAAVFLVMYCRLRLSDRRLSMIAAQLAYKPQVVHDAFEMEHAGDDNADDDAGEGLPNHRNRSVAVDADRRRAAPDVEDGPNQEFPEHPTNGSNMTRGPSRDEAALINLASGHRTSAPPPLPRHSIVRDGEVSIGFNDDDFVIAEADRADGVSFAGSLLSRRSTGALVTMPNALEFPTQIPANVMSRMESPVATVTALNVASSVQGRGGQGGGAGPSSAPTYQLSLSSAVPGGDMFLFPMEPATTRYDASSHNPPSSHDVMDVDLDISAMFTTDVTPVPRSLIMPAPAATVQRTALASDVLFAAQNSTAAAPPLPHSVVPHVTQRADASATPAASSAVQLQSFLWADMELDLDAVEAPAKKD